MAIPSFGPSQRIEISRLYLNLNESIDRRNGYRVYDAINPRDNVAEEGQVVLLRNEHSESRGGFYGHTFVVPDAAGYVADVDVSAMQNKEKVHFLYQEILKYNVGVNQVEKGVKSPHTSTGNGWDISLTPGQHVVIRNTGHEPIFRSNLIGVRFPTDEDMRAQADVWSNRGGSSNRGNCVSKFATYPIYENEEEMMKHERFVADSHAFRDNIIRGYTGAETENVRLELMQIPALFNLLRQVWRCMNAGSAHDDRMKEALAFTESEMRTITTTTPPDHSTSSIDSTTIRDIMMSDDSVDELMKVAKAACDFTSTLRPGIVLAKCLDFKGAQPQQKMGAQCGDAMKCILL